eukprot:3904148-Pyramimonas_sp.AAC.1
MLQVSLPVASKLPPVGPRTGLDEIRTNIQQASYPKPRHGGGMGRLPLYMHDYIYVIDVCAAIRRFG